MTAFNDQIKCVLSVNNVCLSMYLNKFNYEQKSCAVTNVGSDGYSED